MCGPSGTCPRSDWLRLTRPRRWPRSTRVLRKRRASSRYDPLSRAGKTRRLWTLSRWRLNPLSGFVKDAAVAAPGRRAVELSPPTPPRSSYRVETAGQDPPTSAGGTLTRKSFGGDGSSTKEVGSVAKPHTRAQSRRRLRTRFHNERDTERDAGRAAE